jgi:hypothetical protein
MSPRRIRVLIALGAALTSGALDPLPSDAPATGAAPTPGHIEVRADDDGLYAYRVRGPDGRWALPNGDAVLLDEAWWTPLRPLTEVVVAQQVPDRALMPRLRRRLIPPWADAPPGARVTAATLGDVTQDGEPELVVSFRRTFRPTLINVTRPRRVWTDRRGLSAHLGLYRPDDLSDIWVAGTLTRPVARLAACDGAIAVAYDRMDDTSIVETGAWRWVVFGFLPIDPLPGPGIPVCVDIDGDGRTEPAIMERSAR